MRDAFPGYYRPSNDEFKKLWEEAIFVFDANVLLNLYRYSQVARRDFLNLLESIKDRIWIPHQVALEYQQNRLEVIEERSKRYDETEEILRQINEHTVQLRQLKERHPTINPDRFIVDVERLISRFRNELARLKEAQADIVAKDKLNDVLRFEHESLFEGKVGDPLSNDALQKLYADGKVRYERKLPPGYKDNDKKGYYSFNGQMIERKYGDLIVWFQLLEEVKSKKHPYIILVTDDSKEDWWWKYDGKTIGPRPELVGEIRKTGCELFYMYNPTNLLKYARENLKSKIQDTSIIEVEATSAEQNISTNLVSIAYNPDTKMLELEFASGMLYVYRDVPQDIYEGLLTAGSQGSYFDQNIKNGEYAYIRKVRPIGKPAPATKIGNNPPL